jgi:hypothetical protein
MRSKFAAVTIVGLLVLFTGGGYAYYAGSPQYALGQVALAVETSDRLKFERHVDIDRIVTRAIDDVVAGAMADLIKDDDTEGFAALGVAFGAAMLEGMKPLIRTAAKNAIYQGIESGDVASALANAKTSDFDLAGMAGGGFSRSAFEGLGKVRKQGDVSIVPLRFREADHDTTLSLDLRMERSDRVWRVVAFENLREYVETLRALEEAAVASENERAEAEFAAILRTGPVRRSVRDDGWVYDVVTVAVDVTNTGAETITELQLQIHGSKPLGTTLVLSGTLEPNETKTLSTRSRVSSFSSDHALTYEHLTTVPKLARVRRDGELVTVARVGSWEELRTRRAGER